VKLLSSEGKYKAHIHTKPNTKHDN
jgi:hypothetical protein